MKNLRKIFLICLLFFNFNFFAEDNLKSKFIFDEYPSKEIKGIYSLTEKDMKEYPEYSMGWLLSFDNVNEIKSFYYFPPYNNEVNYGEGKFVINNRLFVTKDTYFIRPFYYESERISSITYNDRTYLILLGPCNSKYYEIQAFIFDITDPENILFIPPEEKYIEAEFENKFFGIYQGKLCFFLSTWNNRVLSPYYIEEETLKPLCDEIGHPYFVKYTHYFTENYERAIEITDEYIPK